MKMITIYYFDLIVSQLTSCSNYVKLFWYDEELFVRSFLCSVPWFVIADFGNQQVLFNQIIAFFTSAAFNGKVENCPLLNFVPPGQP